MEAQVDLIGNSYVEMNIKEFIPWLRAHEQQLKNMSMKTLNHKIHWIDDNKNRFKLHHLRGKFVLKRCCQDYFNDKHDFMNKLVDLDRQLKELAYTFENLIKSETPLAEPGKEGNEEPPKPVLSMRFPKV